MERKYLHSCNAEEQQAIFRKKKLAAESAKWEEMFPQMCWVNLALLEGKRNWKFQTMFLIKSGGQWERKVD